MLIKTIAGQPGTVESTSPRLLHFSSTTAEAFYGPKKHTAIKRLKPTPEWERPPHYPQALKDVP